MVNQTTVQETINDATNWMINLANDNSHGYDQIYRWGEKGDYDCSSAVITAWQQAGVPVKSSGATYTGNMKDVFLRLGFKDVTRDIHLSLGYGLQRGDVLLNEINHTAMYIGNGQLAQASINEKGTATYGTPGDQTGREVNIRSYYNYPWDCVLRFEPKIISNNSKVKTMSVALNEVQEGVTNQSVWVLRTMLRGRGYKTRDNKPLKRSKVFDADTTFCVKKFQEKFGLDVDGIVGPMTWSKLMGIQVQ